MSITIDYDLEINAPAHIVWEVISDTARYSEWNPFVLKCRTTLQPGAELYMEVKLGNSIQKTTEIIDEVNEGRGFSYRMKPPPLGALSSYRSHDIEPLDDSRCRYRSHFELNGWLSPLVKLLMHGKLKAGFGGMTHAIKERAEELAQARQAA